MTDPRTDKHSAGWERTSVEGQVQATTLQQPTVDFSTLYEKHLGYVCFLLRKWGVAERNLEDAAHDAFVVVHRRLGECGQDLAERPWLAAIAFKVAAAWRRRAFQRQDLGTEVPDIPDERPNAEHVAAQREASAQLVEVLELMDEEKRMVFVLHELEGHAVPAIAAALGVPTNTAYSRLRLARSQFVTLFRQVRREDGRT